MRGYGISIVVLIFISLMPKYVEHFKKYWPFGFLILRMSIQFIIPLIVG